jgi:hypothetical protein
MADQLLGFNGPDYPGADPAVLHIHWKKLLSHETYTAIPSHIFPVNMKNQAIVLPWDE